MNRGMRVLIFILCNHLLVFLAYGCSGSRPLDQSSNTVQPTVEVVETSLPDTGEGATPEQPSKKVGSTSSPEPSKTPFSYSTASSADTGRVMPGSSGCLATLGDEVANEATLEMGPSNGVPATTAKGEKLVIIGTVYDSSCNPLSSASLNAHQTDANGEYGPGHGSDSLRCCYLQGQGKTDENGRFKLVSVVPGHYAGQNPPPPAHIHLEVSHPETGSQMAEIVFAGDPFLEWVEEANFTVVALEDAGDPDQGTLYKLGFADFRLPGGSGSTPQPAAVGMHTFQIDPQRSQAAYHIREKFNRLPIQIGATGISSQVEGAIELNLDSTPQLQSMQVEVDLRELKSNHPDRDEKLFDRWLETNRYPTASFTASRIEGFPENFGGAGEVSFKLWGDLTIRDVTREVPFDVNARLEGNVLSGTAAAKINMSDFGIDPPSMLDFVVVEDEVELTINLVAVNAEG